MFGLNEKREYACSEKNPDWGRTTMSIECPFCGEWFEVYMWSFAGSGKRCPGCKAMHRYQGAYTTFDAVAFKYQNQQEGGRE